MTNILTAWRPLFVTMVTMAYLDCFLISEHEGNKRTGVTVLLLIADVSILAINRLLFYASYGLRLYRY